MTTDTIFCSAPNAAAIRTDRLMVTTAAAIHPNMAHIRAYVQTTYCAFIRISKSFIPTCADKKKRTKNGRKAENGKKYAGKLSINNLEMWMEMERRIRWQKIECIRTCLLLLHFVFHLLSPTSTIYFNIATCSMKTQFFYKSFPTLVCHHTHSLYMIHLLCGFVFVFFC